MGHRPTRTGTGCLASIPHSEIRVPHSLAARLKAEAARRGFALSGIAPATDADGFGRFAAWLDRGYAGEMDYLHRLRDERRHPSSILESVRSVLMVGLEYGPGFRIRDSGFGADPDPTPTAAGALHLSTLGPESRILNPARVASYATGP